MVDPLRKHAQRGVCQAHPKYAVTHLFCHQIPVLPTFPCIPRVCAVLPDGPIPCEYMPVFTLFPERPFVPVQHHSFTEQLLSIPLPGEQGRIR